MIWDGPKKVGWPLKPVNNLNFLRLFCLH